ncbi:MAG: metalloregulator ArsR/SmtB family transcription factor [Gammaproteobacteria bacterium]|nr:metalloregulator ArsR/SmtB family transcription factor [Gammaproteobacteria bacterium]
MPGLPQDHPSDLEKQLLSLESMKQAAECLKCIAHPQRLRIIEILLSGEYSVDSIARLCSLTQPATSGHLRLMEGKGLLKSERRGRTVFYRVSEPHLENIIECIRHRFG